MNNRQETNTFFVDDVILMSVKHILFLLEGDYVSLYNKYRPMSWDAVIGQGGISETLKNAIISGDVSSTYLFHGPRGTGKTTCARIFAKALNCESPIAPGVPCTKCGNCQDIADDRSPHVTEMDAATNTGVDSMRDLKSSANMITGGGGWRVFIIDECHMLSKSAQNSGLKLFEESPEKTVFILCTTELHKVEGTIISRSLRFDFRPVSVEDIVGRLQVISDGEGIEADGAALKAVAKAARGSVRDSISILERVSVENIKKINMTSVVRSLGITPIEIMLKLGDVIKGDYKKGFEIASQVIADGYDIHTFLQGSVDYFRDLLMIEVGITEGLMIEQELMSNLLEVAASVSLESITHAIEVLDEAVSKYRYNDNKQILVEMSLYKIAKGVGQVAQPISHPHVQQPALQPVQQPVQQQPIIQRDTINSVSVSAPEEQQISAPVNQGQMPNTDYDRVCNNWQVYIMELAKVDHDASLWLQRGRPYSFDYDELIIMFPSIATLDVQVFNERFIPSSSKVLSGCMGKPVTVRAVVEQTGDESGLDGDTVGSVTYMHEVQIQEPPGFIQSFRQQRVPPPYVNQAPVQQVPPVAVHNGIGSQGSMNVVQPTQPIQTQSVSSGGDISIQPIVTSDFLKNQFGDGSGR